MQLYGTDMYSMEPNVDPSVSARKREGNNGLLVATVTLGVLLLVILIVLALTFTTAPYCGPGHPCDAAAAPAFIHLLV